MKQPDRLFLLIKSLNKNEKIYFKRYSKKEENNYLKLFDAISGRKQYNEQELLHLIGKQKFEKQLRVVKSRLFNGILKSLQDYYYNASLSNVLKNELRNVEILYKRGLFNSCFKILSKAKSEFYRSQNTDDLMLLEIIRWQQKLLIEQKRGIRKTEGLLTDFKKEENEAHKKYINNRELRFLLDQIILIQTKSLSEFDMEKLERLALHPLLEEEKNALSVMAKFWFNNFWVIYYHLKEDTGLTIKFGKNYVRLMEENPMILKNQPTYYLSALLNLVIGYCGQKQYAEALAVINKIKKFPVTTTEINFLKFEHPSLLELIIHTSTGNFKKAAALIGSINNSLNKYSERMSLSIQMHYYFEIAYALFGTREYKMSLKWVNKILPLANKGIREDVIDATALFSLILYYELGYDELLKSKIRSLLLSYKRSGERYSSAILFIKALEAIVKEKDPKKTIAIFKNLKLSIPQIYPEIIYWIDSKLHGKSFAEVVKQKNYDKNKLSLR